ncbi:hypothetical protein [Leptospira mayottensis]|uniref:hypothetical protein n=1 Tax=Leptospira mayottensis TaxID=1137606 RepID=UPI0020B132B8|nr:hypothetical protein [Leptospira mayottensis]
MISPIPTDLLAYMKDRTHKIVSDFSQSDEMVRKSISQLTQISWEDVFTKTVDQLDTNWKELGTDPIWRTERSAFLLG